MAIVDAYNDPNINADLQTFDSQYGLAACSTTNGCLQVVNETGGTTLPANDTTGWSLEETLRFAGLIGASACTRLGCTAGVLSRPEAEAYLQTHRPPVTSY